MGGSDDVNPAARVSEGVYTPSPVRRHEHAEGVMTRLIEQQTAKVPSDVFLFAALGTMGLSLTLHLAGRRDLSRFVGMWPPAILTMGLYNKVVKTLQPR